jgi:membrane-associated protein
MDWLWQIIDLVLHLNKYLAQFIDAYGAWVYLLIFLIVFCESGLIFTPFLPGDALLFTVGSLTAGTDKLDLLTVLILLSVAAPVGGFANYFLGSVFGDRFFKNPHARVLNPKYLGQAHAFYERHGAKAILLARYLPMIRTFAPFVAGMSKMSYAKFAIYNLVGGIVWVFLLVLLGHFFGSFPFVQKNFSIVIGMIILISMVPPGLEFFRAWQNRSKA